MLAKELHKPFVASRRRFLGKSAAFLIVLSVQHPVVAAEASARKSSSADALQRFLVSTKGASGRFKETVFGKDGKVRSSAEGEFAFLRPGRFAWVYKKPYVQRIICDGRKLWIYDEDLMQVTVKPVGSALPQTPAAILFGDANIEEDWHLEEKTLENGCTSIRAVPREEGGFQAVEFVFSQELLPLEMTLFDLFGQRTRYVFESFSAESPDEKLFRFEPPKGVDVNDMSAEAFR